MKKTSCAAAALVLLAACGSGDGSPADPDEPNDSMTLATPITIGGTVVGRIARVDDVDFYAFTVPEGGATVRFETFDAGGVDCDPVSFAVDPYIEVYDGGGTLRGEDDDGGVGPWCDDVSVALPAGQAYVMIGGNPDLQGVAAFDYALRVSVP